MQHNRNSFSLAIFFGDTQFILELFFVDGAAFTGGVVAEICQIAVDDSSGISFAYSEPKFIVHAKMLIFIKKTSLGVNFTFF